MSAHKDDKKKFKDNVHRQQRRRVFKFNDKGRNIKETDIIDELSIPDESNYIEKPSSSNLLDISCNPKQSRVCLTSLQSERKVEDIYIAVVEEPKFNSKIERLEWEL